MVRFNQSCVQSDVGRVRTNNEDSVLLLPALVAVADGMGGHDDGEVASRIAVETVDEYRTVLTELADDRDQLRLAAEEIFQIASDRVGEAAGDGQMGTTLVAAVLAPDGYTAYVAHVGDSRAYLHRGGALIPITRDHNVYNLLLQEGRSEAEAAAHPAREKLVQGLGFGYVRPDVAEVILGAGDTLLLCSDGLCGVVDEPTIASLLGDDLETSARALIRAARARGGPDNISVGLARVAGDAPSHDARRLQRLGEMFLFADLDDAQLRNVATFLTERRWAAGDTIIEEGEVGDECMVFIDGTAQVFRGDLFLTEVGPGGHIGELSLTGPWVRSATVRASTAVTAEVITRAQYETLCRTRPQIGVIIARALAGYTANRLARITDRLQHVQLALSGHYDAED